MARDNRDDPGKLITKRRFNLIEGMVNAADAREEGSQSLGFAAREFVLCGLPYKRVNALKYERRNGSCRLRVTADPDFGLPFGQDRLIPIWLATAFRAAGMPANNTIRFRAARDILRAFGISTSGVDLQRLVPRIRRIFGATFYARHDGHSRIREQSYRLISALDLWIDRKAHPNQYTLWHNHITLSHEFAEDLRRCSIPIDLDSVRALRTRPAALDLYVWQAWRSYRLAKSRKSRDIHIPIFGEGGLLAQIGTTITRHYKARELLRRAQTAVKAVWPGCPNELDGDTFVIRPGAAVNSAAPLSLVGVSHIPDILAPSPSERPDLLLRRPPPPSERPDLPLCPSDPAPEHG